MSFYNSLFGYNSAAGILLSILNLKPDDIPRFRDCFYDSEKHQIVVHTRTGGGNRQYYESEEICRKNFPEDFLEENPPSAPWNSDLQSHPLYVSDEDDDYDSTYANFYFAVPDEYSEHLKDIFKNNSTIKPAEKWEILLNKMDSLKNER